MQEVNARSYFCDVALVPLALCIAQIFLSVMEIQGGPSSSSASVVPSSDISLSTRSFWVRRDCWFPLLEARKAW